MTSEPTPERDDDVLAAEYALHLLSFAERAEFDDRMAGDGALRNRLAFWADHFAGLADAVPEVAPPAGLRRALEDAVKAPTAPQTRGGFSFLRLFGGAGLALAVGLAVIVQLPDVRLPSPFMPDFFAGIEAQEGALLVSVAYSLESGEIEVNRTAGAAPAGRVLQLWAILPDQPTPISLGVLPDTATARLVVPEALQGDLPGATLAISEEPPGGSPLAGPSGAVLGAASLIEA